eukprot:7119829-Prorocentrum_lima.AAC.1
MDMVVACGVPRTVAPCPSGVLQIKIAVEVDRENRGLLNEKSYIAPLPCRKSGFSPQSKGK